MRVLDAAMDLTCAAYYTHSSQIEIRDVRTDPGRAADAANLLVANLDPFKFLLSDVSTQAVLEAAND